MQIRPGYPPCIFTAKCKKIPRKTGDFFNITPKTILLLFFCLILPGTDKLYFFLLYFLRRSDGNHTFTVRLAV